MTIKVIIAEDQHMVRGALKALLSLEDGLKVVADLPDGKQALDAVKIHDVDVLVTDIEMPHMSGLELAEAVKAQKPECKVVVLTTFNRKGYVKRAMDLAIDAFVLKDAPGEQLANSIRAVMAGKKVFDPQLMLDAMDETDPLSDKQRQALRLAGEGLSSQEIADRLYLSKGTVRNYLSEAISKLQAHNRIDAARKAKQKGWL